MGTELLLYFDAGNIPTSDVIVIAPTCSLGMPSTLLVSAPLPPVGLAILSLMTSYLYKIDIFASEVSIAVPTPSW